MDNNKTVIYCPGSVSDSSQLDYLLKMWIISWPSLYDIGKPGFYIGRRILENPREWSIYVRQVSISIETRKYESNDL